MHPHATFPDYQPQLVRPLNLFKLVDSSEIMNEDALPMRRDESRDWWNSAARGLFHTTMKQHDLSCMTYGNWMDLPWILVIFFNIWRWNQTSNTDAKDLECFPEISVVLPQRGRIGRCFFFKVCVSFLFCKFLSTMSSAQKNMKRVTHRELIWDDLIQPTTWKIQTKTWQCLPQSTP